MNNNYNVTIEMPISGTMSQCENFSSSTSSAYEEISPHQHNGTPVSNDSHSGRQNPSTLSSKKSEISMVSSEENAELAVDNLERTLTEGRLSKIEEILLMLSNLNDKEQLLIQTRFPFSENDNYDENNEDVSGLCDFGTGANQNDHSEALTWVMSHLEEDHSICLKKQEVFDEYKDYCESHNMKYLSTADFGKVMKKAFPGIKARRLGSRGKSKYCYSGLKNRNQFKSPMIIDVGACCNKIDNTNDINHQDKNSDIDSNSSNCPQPDLSNVPEYQLSANILVDSALVIMDFMKHAGLRKEVTSLRQAVEYLLLNNQVETRSPHALRLLPIFQQLDSNKLKKRYLTDQVVRIKKEESLASPNSVPLPFHPSSPNQLKRQKMNFGSPIADKVVPYFGHNKVPNTPPLSNNHGYCHPSNNNTFNYPIPGNNVTQQYCLPNMITMPPNISRPGHNFIPEMSQNLCQKSFIPNTSSTPIKDTSVKNISPTLNSPLLERNPSTTKKLELSNTSKSLYQNNSITYQNLQQHTPVPEHKPPKLSFYNSPVGFPYEQSHVKPTKTSYLDTDVGSPSCSPMTSRNYVSFTDDYNDDIEKLEIPRPLKRHIGSDYQIDFNPSPSLNHYDNDYGANISSLSSGYRHQGSEENEYLDTPGNSPTNRSTDHDPSETSSRNNTPLNCSGHLILPENKSSLKSSYFSLNPSMSVYPNNIVNNNISQLLNYQMEQIHRVNDEFSVSSTTNTCPLDTDRHPSTTMLHSAVLYK